MSEIRATTISDLAGTGPATLTGQYAAKAWVNFNGTGAVAIRESGNASSITDNGLGNYTVTFATAMPDADYAISGAMFSVAFSQSLAFGGVKAASSCNVLTTTGSGFADFSTVDFIIHR